MRARLGRALANLLLVSGVVLIAFALLQVSEVHQWLLVEAGLDSRQVMTVAEDSSALAPAPSVVTQASMSAASEQAAASEPPPSHLVITDTSTIPTGGETAPAPTPAATPPPMPGRMIISSIGLDARVVPVSVQGGEWEVADNAVGYSEGTGIPGRIGNAVFAGHVDIEGQVFRNLKLLGVGRDVVVVSGHDVYTYRVNKVLIVNPTDTWVMDPSPDARATLVTCWPDFFRWNVAYNSKRLVVQARLTSPPIDDHPQPQRVATPNALALVK